MAAEDSLLAALTTTAPGTAGTERPFSSVERTSMAPATALPMSAGVAPVRRITLARSAVLVLAMVVVVTAATVVGGSELGVPATVVGAAVVGGAVVVGATVVVDDAPGARLV